MPELDPLLVKQAKGGSRPALERLLGEIYDDVALLCRRMTADQSDAEDCTQLALIAISRGIGKFDGRSKPWTWCYRVATNACLDEMRRRSRRGIPTDPHIVADVISDTDRGVVGPERTVTARLDLDAALAQLPEEFRVPLVLRELGDLDYRDIAETLHVPIGTVKSRIARGRKLLSEVLSHE